MSLDLEAIKQRDAFLRSEIAWTCQACQSCSDCGTTERYCEEHDDDGDVPALVAEVEMLRHAYDELKSDADAEVGRLKLKLDGYYGEEAGR